MFQLIDVKSKLKFYWTLRVKNIYVLNIGLTNLHSGDIFEDHVLQWWTCKKKTKAQGGGQVDLDWTDDHFNQLAGAKYFSRNIKFETRMRMWKIGCVVQGMGLTNFWWCILDCVMHLQHSQP